MDERELSFLYVITHSKPIMLALIMLVAGVLMALYADYPVYDRRAEPTCLTFMGPENKSIGLPSFDGFSPYNSTLEIEADKHVIVDVVVNEGEQVKQVELDANKTMFLSFDGAPRLNITLIEGSFPITLKCTYVVDGYTKPYLWLGIPAAILIFAGTILAIRGYVDLIGGILEEQRQF